MNEVAVWGGALIVLVTLWEAFETMILPRAIHRTGRVTHLFYRTTHWAKQGIASRIPFRPLRETILSVYAPLSLLLLVAFWAVLLIVGFGLLQWGLHIHFLHRPPADLGETIYFSGTTFFTLGYGDLAPIGSFGRFLAVLEAGLGFAMLASVIGYLPILYQAFSNREAVIGRLANRCGGEIDGVGLVVRYARSGNYDGLAQALEEFEGWISEVVENTASYPMLAAYRSQREDSSWIGAFTAVMDATVVLQLPVETPFPTRVADQAELTYAIGRRAFSIISATLRLCPDATSRRFREPEALRERLRTVGIEVTEGFDERWEELVGSYEPEAEVLAHFLTLSLPAWPVVPPVAP